MERCEEKEVDGMLHERALRDLHERSILEERGVQRGERTPLDPREATELPLDRVRLPGKHLRKAPDADSGRKVLEFGQTRHVSPIQEQELAPLELREPRGAHAVLGHAVPA